jgi:hypothetical protein
VGQWPSQPFIRWDEKAGLRRDAVGSQVIEVLKAQEIKETGHEEPFSWKAMTLKTPVNE